MLVRSYVIQGRDLGFTSQQVAEILDVPHEGVAIYEKGKWPAEYKREAVLAKITTLETIPKSGDVINSCMTVENRVIHGYVKDNLVPRGEKRTNVGIIDSIYVLCLLDGELLNLPWIIMKHMEHLKTKPGHALPFGSLIKKLLIKAKAYEEGKRTQRQRVGIKLDDAAMGKIYLKWAKDKWVSTKEERIE